MEGLKEQFERAAREVQSLDERPDNETLLKLYALYKQASAGDVRGKRPGFTDFAGRAKYDAWKRHQGMAPEAAMQAYVDLVKALTGA